MDNLILIVVLVVIIGAAARYVYKERKRGTKCIGCPDGCKCGSTNGEGCGCGCGCSGESK